MPSNSGNYDEALLGSAPKPNREQLQEGYDPKLLENNNRPNTVTPTPTQEKLLRPVTAPIDSDPELAGAKPLERSKPVPFWRTKKGMIIIGGIVLICVIVAAVVGGVVGSQNKNDNKGSESASTPLSSATPTPSGGDTNQPNSVPGDQVNQNPTPSNTGGVVIPSLIPTPTQSSGGDDGQQGAPPEAQPSTPPGQVDTANPGDTNMVDTNPLAALGAALPN